MSQKFSENKFESIKDTSQFNEDFIKDYHEEIDGGYFLEVDIQYHKKLYKIDNDLSYLPENLKIEKNQNASY